MMDDANGARRQLARALMSRGHLQAGLELLTGQEQTVPFAEAALLGAVPVEEAAAAFRGRASDPFSPPFVARFPWWASRSDTASLRRARAWSDSVARSDPDPNARTASSYVAASAAALPDGGCPTCYLDRLTLAQLLVERRRDRDAWRILQGEQPAGTVVPLPTEVLWVLLRGRVGERLGQRDRAGQAYAWVAGMWRNADPVLQPYLHEAREGLARLVGERR
jgi:hypothetical protein